MLEGIAVHETFDSSPDALRALAEFYVEEGSRPPREYASELHWDGLIDVHST